MSSSVHYSRMGGADRRIAELENLCTKLLERIDQLERSRFAQWIGGGDGDRVEGFMLNAQLDARAGCEGYGDAVSATILDDDGELTSESIELGDIIMSPGDFIAAGSKGFMRLRNGEWKVLVPYCKPSGENPPPQSETPPEEEENPMPPPGEAIPAFEIEVYELIVPPTSQGGMTNEIDELP